MCKENDSFIVEYDEKLEYIEDLMNTLGKEMQKILDFFEIKNLKEKKKVKIWSSRSKYQQHLESYVSKYYDWMIADTFDGNINMLSIDECRKTKHHSDITMDYFLRNIVHEFVHACQQEINSNSENVEWFWEALATNLGNPFDHVTSIHYSKEEIMYEFNSLPYNYNVAYTIGKFMLENYSHTKILEYVKNPKKLIDNIEDILFDAKQWFNKKYLMLPTVPKAENNDFVIYSSDTLQKLSNDILNELSTNKKRILDFFKLSDYRKVEVNLYDSQEDFIKFLKNIRSPKWPIPDYCKGTYDDNMINHSIDLKTLGKKYSNYLKSSVHEFVHIIYNDVMAGERVIWLDEGLALNLSGEYKTHDDDNVFKTFFEKDILSIKRIPVMNELVHGESFVNENYNGYKLSYLAVKYMLETMSHDDVLSIIKDNTKSKLLGQTVLNDAIKYYSKKFSLI